jgi:MYXO-CTERM domain-containing protein
MSARRSSSAASAACIALSLFGSAQARAFCRSNTCDPARGEVCTVDKDGCRKGGELLYWNSAPIPFLVQTNGSVRNQIDGTSFEHVISAAFHTWSSANCGLGKHPSISGMSAGQTASDAVEYIEGGSNANLFTFRDETWLATIPGSALALTTVSYDWHTGLIYDADVEVNGTGGNITNTRPGDGADLPSIITHEVGHFLGLDHSQKPTATMFITYVVGKGNLRSLDADDVAAICALYPPGGASSAHAAAAAAPGSSRISAAPLAGCSLSSEGRQTAPHGLWAILVLGAWLGARRRRAQAAAGAH